MHITLVIHSKGGTSKTLLTAALSDRIKGSEMVDLDPQKSLKTCMSLSGKKKVFDTLAEVPQATRYVIIDTPPYRTSETEGLIGIADKIIVPCSVGLADLVVATKTVESISKKGALDKTILVFTRVRLPINNTFREIKSAFKSNFPHVKIAKNMFSQRIAYQKVFGEPLKGKAMIEIQNLIEEFGIKEQEINK